MNKSDLISAAAAGTGVARKDAEQVVNTFLKLIADGLVRGEKVQLSGFGTFEVREREARMGRDMQNNEPKLIPAGRVPAFKASQNLKDLIGK